jgi:3-hydroxymyristoyl/3-hydroxydecanoyl-(acyl carrier protein) dehydratase
MRMIDTVEVFDPAGGPAKLGAIRGGIDVDPAAWFFKAHFHQDPVWPGSLGIESFLQLLSYIGYERWNTGAPAHFLPWAPNHTHRWTYRGQIIPKDNRVTVDAWITRIDDDQRLLIADGFLSVDGRTIYQMNGFAIRFA